MATRSMAKIRIRWCNRIRQTKSQRTWLYKRAFEHFENCIALICRVTRVNMDRDIIFLFTYISPVNSPIYNDMDSDGISQIEDYFHTVIMRSHYDHEHIFFGVIWGELQDAKLS